MLFLKAHGLRQKTEHIPVALTFSLGIYQFSSYAEGPVPIGLKTVCLLHREDSGQKNVRIQGRIREETLMNHCKEIFPEKATNHLRLVTD